MGAAPAFKVLPRRNDTPTPSFFEGLAAGHRYRQSVLVSQEGRAVWLLGKPFGNNVNAHVQLDQWLCPASHC